MRSQLQQTLEGSYKLEQELGGGGMSRVFVAEEIALGRKVVIKVLPPELGAAVNLERFRREIQLAAKLQHPNIVPVLVAGDTEGLPYYTMPFVEGESLRSRIEREGALPIQDIVRILRDVLSALAYAHEHGVVHRDIKPDNVLLTKYASQVTDFGIAKALTASAAPGSFVTSLGVALGTPAYMAPEQVAADPTIDHRADLYAVGAMGYELLTGSQMFGGRSPQATMAAHAIEKPLPVLSKRPSTPPLLAEMIMRAVEKNAADRPQSAEEMSNVLEKVGTGPFSTDQGVVPTPSAAPSRNSNRLLLIAIVIGLLALIAVTLVMMRRRDRSASAEIQPRLAVLPFENGGDSADAYFADGMTEAITNRLASISGLSVIGRQSSKRYVRTDKSPQQIGSELGVNYLLTGTVRWDKSHRGRNLVSVRPALLRTADGTQVWGDPYEGVLSEEFKLQSDVAEKVARALNVKLLAHESQSLATKPTDDPVAYDDYLKGQFFLGKRTTAGVQQALDHFTRAVNRDPRFARAYAGLAEVYVVMPSYTDATMDSSRSGVRKNAAIAIRLDSTLASPHASLGAILRDEHRWSEAESEFKRAIALEPAYPTTYQWYSRMLASVGKFPEAIALAEKARKLDPLSAILNLNLGTIQLYGGRYAAAESTLKATIMMDPENASAHWTYSTVLGLKGNLPAAIGQIDTALALNSSRMVTAKVEAYRAVALASGGDTAAARSMINRIKANPRKNEFGYELSLLHMTLGEKDSTIAWIGNFLNSPSNDPFFLRIPFFDPVRNDPRFQALLHQALKGQ